MSTSTTLTNYEKLLEAFRAMLGSNSGEISPECERLVKELSGLMTSNIFFDLIHAEIENMNTGARIENDVIARIQLENDSINAKTAQTTIDIATLKEEETKFAKAANKISNQNFFTKMGEFTLKTICLDAPNFIIAIGSAILYLICWPFCKALGGSPLYPLWDDHVCSGGGYEKFFDKTEKPTDHTASASATCANDQTEITQANGNIQTQVQTVLTPRINEKSSFSNVINNAIEGIKACSMSG